MSTSRELLSRVDEDVLRIVDARGPVRPADVARYLLISVSYARQSLWRLARAGHVVPGEVALPSGQRARTYTRRSA